MRNENITLKELDHPGIVTMHGAFQEKKNLYLVLDYAMNGDMSQMLAKRSLKTFKIKQFYIA